MEQQMKTNFSHQLIYQKINKLNYNDVKRILDTGNDCIINIEFMNESTDKANLRYIQSGYYDKQLLKFLNDSKKDGRHFQIRTLHEFNGNWYPWGIYRNGNSLTDFHRSWYHVARIIKESGANVSLQLNYNQISYSEMYTFEEMYPGDKYVDKIVITTYNRAGTDEEHKQWRTFKDNFDKPYTEITSFTNKPIGIAEISSTSHKGFKPAWIIIAAINIDKNYSKVDEVTWFLNNKEVNGFQWDWDMNSYYDMVAFRIANNKILV